MLAIVVPEKTYINILLERLSYSKEESIIGTEVYKANYNDHSFLIMTTGYGKVNIARSLQYLCDNYKVSVVMQIGTTGSINDSNDILSSVIPNNTLQFDVDFTPLGQAPGCIPLLKKGVYTANSDLVECMKKSSMLCNTSYSNDLIASSDMFVCNNSLSNSVRREYMATAVDCESGAVGEFCYINNIPFVIVKVISNFAYNSALRQYNLYDNEASNISQKIAYKFLEQYYD